MRQRVYFILALLCIMVQGTWAWDGSGTQTELTGSVPTSSYTEVKDASFQGAADYERCIKAAEEKIEGIKKSLNL